MYPEGQTCITAEKAVTRAEAETCRHRSEKRWYVILIIINIMMIAAVVGGLAVHADQYRQKCTAYLEQVQESISEGGTSLLSGSADHAENEPSFDIKDLPWDIKGAGIGIAMIFALYIVTIYLYAEKKANSVRITAQNFPEVYEIVLEQAKQLGMKKIPEIYVIQGSGILNAFSAFLPNRQYIIIYTEIFEVAYREHHDTDTLRFIIGHEMAHIYYGHATLHYNLPILFSRLLPVFGTTASRAREYSCDRLAQHLTGTDGIDSMMMLIIDRHLYKQVNVADYLKHAEEQHGFFLWLSNLLSDHPVACKRIPALAKREGSGALY